MDYEVKVEEILSEGEKCEECKGDDGDDLKRSVVVGNTSSEHNVGIAVIHVQHKVEERQDQQISIDNEPKFPDIEANRAKLPATQEKTQQSDPI